MINTDYFNQVDDLAEKLYDAEKYSESAAVLESAYQNYPDQYFNITWRLLLCYRQLGLIEKCLHLIEQSNRKGFFFALHWKSWDPIRSAPGNEAILAENNRLKNMAIKNSTMMYEVLLPERYNPTAPAPLFFTMHCDSGFFGNIDFHKRLWKPDTLLQQGFIVVYIQSSQQLSSKGFGWEMNTEQSQIDFQQCFSEVMENYLINTKKIIVSGFSGGATTSIDIAINGKLPIRGFIALCPDKPKQFSIDICKNSNQRGTSGVLLIGEQIKDDPDFLDLVDTLNAARFRYDLIINEGIGHWYPDDLPDKVEKAITMIFDD